MRIQKTTLKPAWRSMLFVPAHQQRMIASAHTRGADAVVLDLEDGVPASLKATARDMLASGIETLAGHGSDVIVRVNRELDECVRDLEVAVRPGVAAITLPKVLGPEHIALIDELIGSLEEKKAMPRGALGLIAMVETADALGQIAAIARTGGRLCGVTIGSEDLALDCSFTPTSANLSDPLRRLVVAAVAAGIAPYGLPGSISEIADMTLFRDLAESACAMGLQGAFCIHPSQVAVLNTAFTPTVAELRWAHGAVAAYEQALRDGHGAVRFEGRMLDLPVVERARVLLTREPIIWSPTAL
jgi:citrate lyase subunit beta/citryl-CoA lyase